jgi:hypothetical protein
MVYPDMVFMFIGALIRTLEIQQVFFRCFVCLFWGVFGCSLGIWLGVVLATSQLQANEKGAMLKIENLECGMNYLCRWHML